MVLISISLMTITLNVFSCVCWPFIDLWRAICSSPLPIFNLSLLFHCYYVGRVLYIFWILSPIHIANVFLNLWVAFSLCCVLQWINLCNFDDIQFIDIFFFVAYVFGVLSKKSLARQCHEVFPYFLLGVLCFISHFRPVIYV